jgi:6,7-dimethyl-8-ribityllumazine synthase
MADRPPHLLIIEARFYDDIADELLRGAKGALGKATFDVITVPGSLEIPAAIAMARQGSIEYDGYVALGCVIRGETTHYETVANESARGLMDLSVMHGLAIGNGILNVENDEKAWARARDSEMDKGGAAVKAALTMIALKARFSE